MKILRLFKYLLTLCLFTLISTFSLYAHAKGISLYDNPGKDAKVIGKIDITAGVVPIISSQDGSWMKVGDPRNGNVGWIKSSDTTGENGNVSITFSQRTMGNDSNGSPQTYQVIQYNNSNNLNQKDAQKVMQQIQMQQESMRNAVQQMLNEMNNIYNMDWRTFNNGNPVIMPIVILPAKPSTQPSTATTTAPATVKPVTDQQSH